IFAVIVTVVVASTWPATKRNSTQENPAGTATDAGSGAADAFELERFTVAPPAGAPLLSCRSTKTSCPLAGAVRVSVIEFTCSGPAGPPVGATSVGGAAIGAVNVMLKVIRLDGWL